MSRPTFNLGQFLDKEKLKANGSNFTDWQRNLRILLGPAKMSYVLDAAIGDPPADDASQEEKNVHQSKLDDESVIWSGMRYAMEAELQKRYEHGLGMAGCSGTSTCGEVRRSSSGELILRCTNRR